MQKKIEQRALLLSTLTNALLTGAGIWIFTTTGIHALFLDAFFSFIALLSSFLAVFISRHAPKKTKSYPDARWFLEPLYAGFKSLLTLLLLSLSVTLSAINAYHYFTTGIGTPMNIDPVLPYSASMAIICFSLGLYNRSQNRKIGYLSTMLLAEAKTNFIDGIQSLGIGVSVLLLRMISIDSSLGFLHYTGDFFMTSLLVLFSLKQPLTVLRASYRELSHATTNQSGISDHIHGVIRIHMLPLELPLITHIFKIGMHVLVRIHLPPDLPAHTLLHLEKARKSILNDLHPHYEHLDILYIF